MAKKVTRDVLEAYLQCKTKAHLKLAGQQGSVSDYEKLLVASGGEVRQAAIGKILERHPESEVARGIPLTAAALRAGPSFVLDATLEDDLLSLAFDGLKRAGGASKLGGHHYVPVLHNHGDKVGRSRKLLLAALGLTIGRVQGLWPIVGLVARGPEARLVKVFLDSKLYRHAEWALEEVKRLQAGGEPPRLTLNKHCPVCEFRQRCYAQAEKDDDEPAPRDE